MQILGLPHPLPWCYERYDSHSRHHPTNPDYRYISSIPTKGDPDTIIQVEPLQPAPLGVLEHRHSTASIDDALLPMNHG